MTSTRGDPHQGRSERPWAWSAALLLAVSLAAALWGTLRDQRDTLAIERNNALIVATERLLSSLKDVETGERGFIITGRDPYLEPYHWGLAAVPADQDLISSMLGANAGKLSGLIAARLREAADGIAAYRKEGSSAGAASIETGLGKSLMDQIRVEIARIQQEVDRRVAFLKRSRRTDGMLQAAALLGLVLSCATLGLVAFQRRRAQRASEALLHGVMENAPIGLGFLDNSLRIRQINHTFVQMSERALSAAPGMSLWEVVPQLRALLEPRLDRLVKGDRTIANIDFDASSNLVQTHIRSYQATFYPLHRAVERRADEGIGMVIADVTARKRAERATKESEERFRSLVEASAAIIWTADKTGAFVKPQPNWTRFTGQSAEAAMGWGRLACVHSDDVEPIRSAWSRAACARTPIALEHRIRRHDGEWRYMALSVAPVIEEDGSLREWVGSHTDVTDRKDAELQLSAAKEAAEDANRAKSAFLANMSHELRTPLSAVIGYSEMLEEEVEELGEAGILTDLGKIKSNAKHLLTLINDVLDLSKVEANKMELFAEDIDVASFAAEVASTVDALVQQKANTLSLDLGESVGMMHSDAVKLRQCLFNLLSNACKFTEGGRITLRIRRDRAPDADWLSFAVADTGMGMTPDQLKRLFQRFTQADETTTRRFGGTGLGLALSRAFAQLLGGDITVESTEGVGTCFTIRVPALMPEPEAEEARPLSDIDQPPAEIRRDLVLVIDDEAAQRELMTRFLERQRFEVRTASDGRSGLEMARSLQPRAILLDVMMPQMDGWSVLKALKADAETARIPVVMVTFVADTGLGASLGAADFVPKPIDWIKLKAVIDQFRDAEGDLLIVDDDPDARQRLRSVLERNGWAVQEAGDGAEALDRVRYALPRLILLDLTMPVMDGFAFLHRLRELPGCDDIPVVVLSARDITARERTELAEASLILKKGETSLRDVATEIRKVESEHDPRG